LQEARRGTSAETLILLTVSMAGALVGAVGGGVLGALQWSVLRRCFSNAGQWIWATVITSSLITASSLYIFYWFSHGVSWN
jgi:hypothetical protein